MDAKQLRPGRLASLDTKQSWHQIDFISGPKAGPILESFLFLPTLNAENWLTITSKLNDRLKDTKHFWEKGYAKG